MTVITTSPYNDGNGHSNQRKLDRCQDGTLWATNVVQGSSADTEFWYSKDAGATWTHASTSNIAGSYESSLFIDEDDYAHFVWKQIGTGGGRNDKRLYYVRGTPNAERTAWTWGTPVALSTTSNGLDYHDPDVVACRTPGSSPTTWDVFIVASWATTTNYSVYRRHRIANDGTVGAASQDGLSHFDSDSGWGYTGVAYGQARSTRPSIDFHHTGDGKTVADATPHIYWGFTAGATGTGDGVRFLKGVFSAGSWSFNPEREIDANYAVTYDAMWFNCLYDGTRVILGGVMRFAGTTDEDLVVWDRDEADTTTTLLFRFSDLAPTYPAGHHVYGSMTYDDVGNVYAFGRSTDGANGTQKVQFRKHDRSAGTTTLTEIEATGNNYVRARAMRGYGGGIDLTYVDETAAPYNIVFHRAASLNAAPGAPTLKEPANSSTVNLADGETFKAAFNDPDSGDTMSSYAFRRKISGAASYEYWNAGTGAWQSTEVFNALTADNGADFTVTFGANLWTNGNIYNWSIATKDQSGVAGPYATDFTVTAGEAPTVTVTAPSGTVADATRPVVKWSYADTEGDKQKTYHVKVFDAATYGAAGFDPETTAAQVDSGEVSSETARSWQPTSDLVNGTSYRAYVKVSQEGPQYSAWAYSAFSLSLDSPAVPTLTAAFDSVNNRVSLDVQGRDNVLTTDDAKGNGTLLGGGTKSGPDADGYYTYTADPDASLVRLYADEADGQTGTYGFTIEIKNPMAADQTYSIDLCDLDSSSHTVTTGAAVTITGTKTTTRWDATYRFLDVQLAPDQSVMVRKASVHPGDGTLAWTRGGLVGTTSVDIEFSDDNGATWLPVRDGQDVSLPAATQTAATVYDHEAPVGSARLYRAKTKATV